ncbi:hypothetical protein HAX54_050522, partial [Datura stramonium]|nr:hypothetical protein [Datura stramonium]
MAKVMNAQSESLQNLDFHISQVLNPDDTPIIYFDKVFKSDEEDPSTYYLIVTTRSGKVELASMDVIDKASRDEVNEEL